MTKTDKARNTSEYLLKSRPRTSQAGKQGN